MQEWNDCQQIAVNVQSDEAFDKAVANYEKFLANRNDRTAHNEFRYYSAKCAKLTGENKLDVEAEAMAVAEWVKESANA
jgi:hypothetical protein